MGTNFYYRIPLKKREKDILHKLVDELPNIDTYEIREKLDEIDNEHDIHLGKRSFGWQFLWNFHNRKFYDTSLKSIRSFLENGGGTIFNEYGEQFSVEDFFGDEIKDCLYQDEKHCDARLYHINHPEEPMYYNIGAHEFISDDGLRFSYSENFS